MWTQASKASRPANLIPPIELALKLSPRDRIDGVLVLDKPLGPSSTQALARARWLIGAAKAGHGGTLDPLASGVLPVLLGEATKFAHDLLDADKSYEACVRLGVQTRTADAEGEIIACTAPICDEALIRAACAEFVGEIVQVPPIHSALKKDGRPLYEYARAGIAVEVPSRVVRIDRLDVLSLSEASSSPSDSVAGRACWPPLDRSDPAWASVQPLDIWIAVDCSKGTYIRTLAADLGHRLGCGAHLAALRRTRVGPLRLDQAITFESLEALEDRGQRRMHLATVDSLLGTLLRVELDQNSAKRFEHGQLVSCPVRVTTTDTFLQPGSSKLTAVPQRVRVYGDGRLMGVATVHQTQQGAMLKPLRLMAFGAKV